MMQHVDPDGTRTPPRVTDSLRLSKLAGRPGLTIVAATVVLFAVISPAVAPTSLHSGSLPPLIVFSSILVLVSLGQMLVIQQRGFDLSVAGAVSLAAVAAAHFGAGSTDRLTMAIVQTLGLLLAAGIVNGLAVAFLKIPPLIATLGMNALLLAVTQAVTGGVSTVDVPPQLADFAKSRLLDVPAPGWITLLLCLLVAIMMKKTLFGRRFELSGTNPRAAEFAGLRPVTYTISAYAIAGLLYATGGLLLAGYVRTPGIDSGTSYLFASVAAVVLGGAALAGGKASTAATVTAAVFLTQLTTVITASGAPPATQYMVQAAIICAGVGIPAVRKIVQRNRRTVERPIRVRRSEMGDTP
ncbi:ABC transporter permease [Streptomyces sp. NPDC060205]|uniref:ABC transporter permease n=1 Tax=Streptomyces sp. NPDC060205 TaxID=3347072 RepID=UPI00364FA814